MRYLVLSDIHANLEALDAVIAAARRATTTTACSSSATSSATAPTRTRSSTACGRWTPDVVIRGNHDKVASGVESAEGFNQAARFAAMWTLEQLTPENRDYLTSLPAGPLVVDDVEICHGSPDDEDEYIFEPVDAIEALRGTSRPLCMFGHTHVPIGYWMSASDLRPDRARREARHARSSSIAERRYMVNPGSVGQPRDGDPRAAYAIVDSATNKVLLCRVAYDVAAAQEKIVEAGLPEGLARAWLGVRASEDARPRRAARSDVWSTRRGLALRPFLAPPQVGGVRVGGGARAENPADHDPDQPQGRDVDEVAGAHLSQVHRRLPASSTRRSSPFSSRSTAPSRRQMLHR